MAGGQGRARRGARERGFLPGDCIDGRPIFDCMTFDDMILRIAMLVPTSPFPVQIGWSRASRISRPSSSAGGLSQRASWLVEALQTALRYPEMFLAR